MVLRCSFLLPSSLCLVVLLSRTFAAPDTRGTVFVFGFLENDPFTTDNELFMSTSLKGPVRVAVTTPKFNPSWKKVVKLTNNRVQNITIPKEIRGYRTENSTKGILIHASDEISVYAVNKEQRSTDAYIVLPLETLGTEYYALTYTKDPALMVVGTKEETKVSIRWSANSGPVAIHYQGQTYRQGHTMNFTLGKFETFHAMQKGSNADFTGAYITASRPIAVLSGNRKVPVPVTSGTADHMTEMLTPLDTWGKNFMTTSTPDREIGDIFRIVASESNTNIAVSKGESHVLKSPGDFLELDIPTGDYQTIDADKPVMMAMFAKTYKTSGPSKGDPSMCIIVPEPQYAANYFWPSIQDPEGEDFSARVALIIDKDKVDGLNLDGNNITWEEQKEIHGSEDKVHLWKHVTPGQHHIRHVDTTVTFMTLVFGSRGGNSYALSAGKRLAKINGPCELTPTIPGDIVDNDCDGHVDEEVFDGIDNDGDGAIDEDLAETPSNETDHGLNVTTNTSWAEWSQWSACEGSCLENNGIQTRSRTCIGPDGEPIPEDYEDLESPDEEDYDGEISADDVAARSDGGRNAGGSTAVNGSAEYEEDGELGDVADGDSDAGGCDGLFMESQHCPVPTCPTHVNAEPTDEDNVAIIIGGVVGGVAVLVFTIVFCIFFLIPYARGKYWCDAEKKKLAPGKEKDDGFYRSMAS